MTKHTTNSVSPARLRRFRRRAAVAGIIALACGCNARLSVSDEGIDDDDDAGAGGTASSNDMPDAAALSGDLENCSDGIRNGGEGDIDCGGACAGCAPGSTCSVHGDCQSASCVAGLCRAPTCSDGVLNGDETSIDCGGTSCMRCASKTCNCALSPELTALNCDETNGTIFPGSPPMITGDGEVAVFMMCHSAVLVPGTPVCTTYRWTSSGSERIADLGVYGMSRDGQRILLQNDDGTWALRDAAGGSTLVPLQDAVLLSADGTKVVNIAVVESAATLQRWSEPGGVERLATLSLPGAYGGYEVRAVSEDGSSIVGFVENEASADVPFLWTDAGGLVTLEPIPEGARGARPTAVSEDGSVVVGTTTGFAAQNISVFRWTSGGFETLAPAEPQNQSPHVMLTADGAVVAATIGYPDPSSPAAWRYATTEGATILSTASSGVVIGMTPDGLTFIGTEDQESVKWVAQPAGAGPPQFTAVRFSTALQQGGVDLTGWEIGPPTSVSDDGRVIFGRGTCGGVQTLYRWVSAP